MSRPGRSIWHAIFLWAGVAALALTGCASDPAASTSTPATPEQAQLAASILEGSAPAPASADSLPAAGETATQLTLDGNRIAPVYQFGLDGHQYALAQVYSGRAEFSVVFIDTRPACSTATSPEELTEWLWVDEPDGLSYLASRLRQACGLEAATPARSPFVVEPPAAARSAPPQTANDAQFGADEPRAGGTFGSAIADVGKQGAKAAGKLLLGLAVLVFAWPALLATGAVVSAVDSAADNKAEDVETQAYEITLPAPEQSVREALGTPAVQFRLPTVDTTVLGYSVDTAHALYVGISDGKAVWIHGPDAWLQVLQEHAEKQQ